jgi:hypothetical protein
MAMRVAWWFFRVVAVVAASGGLCGCSSWSTPVVAAAVVPADTYAGMDCPSLKIEKYKIATEQARLGPTLIPIVDENTRVTELAKLSGELKAIEKAQSERKCS